MQSSYDIAIIGAGPAGMSAALTAANADASVVVLDDKPQPGGQIYRKVGNSPLADPARLGADYMRGRNLLEAFENCGTERLQGATVWHLGNNGEVLFSRNQETSGITARELLLTSGAMERPFPIPGWQLPGVMTAGGAQVMLKSDALVCDDAVFCGTGPLLYQIVAQYLRLGVRVRALVDTTPAAGYVHAMRYLPGALVECAIIRNGLGLLNEIRRSAIPVYRFSNALRIEGEEHVTGLSFTSHGQTHKLSTEHIFLHQGVIPNLNMTRSLGIEHHWCRQQLCWKPKLDAWGQSSISNISVAGDSGAIVGAVGAEQMGRLAALSQLCRLGLITKNERNRQAAPYRQRLRNLNRFRRFIDQLYRPLDEHRIPAQPHTVVCRCEELTVAHLRQGFECGARNPDELKSQTRCGMGPCQGRECGHTVSELLAQWRGEQMDEIGYYRLRSPMRLLGLTELSRFSGVKSKHDINVASR